MVSAFAFFANIVLQPWLHVQLFFPLLALIALRSSRIKTAWCAALLGVLIDVLGATNQLGLHAAIFTAVAMILYSYRRYFFEEKCLPFTLYASIFGVLASFLAALAITFKGMRFTWSLDFIAIDLLFLPLCDAWIGWILFVAPKVSFYFLKRLFVQWRWRTS